jgi:hypothetical protein
MKAIVLKRESIDKIEDMRSQIAGSLFSRIRGKVLALFMTNPAKRYYFRETTRIIGDSPASIQRELKSLTAAGILTMEPIGIQKFYRANKECPIFEELRSIVRKTFGVPDVLREVLSLHKDKIGLAWVDGSGDSDRHGRIKLSIIGSLWIGDLASILEPVERSLGRSIDPNLYTVEDFQRLMENAGDFSPANGGEKKRFIIGTQKDYDKIFIQ